MCLMQQLGPPFIAHRGGVVVYSLIILGLNYIKVDISIESSEPSFVDLGFIITLCLVPLVSLKRLRI
jgi:hypothetical protein